MTDQVSSIARTTACWLAALALLLVSSQTAVGQIPSDRGIGGTGVVPDELSSDRGIGGTGMIGAIRGFGSIIVNNVHVTYAADVPVRIDGQPAHASDLKIGQVVRVVAENRNGGQATRQIEVESEVVGPIEDASRKTLRVLGQTVSLEKLNGAGQWQRGERVAVSGLRRPDGIIVASLIERRTGGPDRIAGRMIRQRDGSFRIERLRLTGADPALAGSRVVLEGSYKAGVLAVTKVTRERDLLKPGIRRFAIEAYIERTGTGFRLGSGLEVAGSPRAALPIGSYAHAVVTAVTDKQGRLRIENVSLEGPPVPSVRSRRGFGHNAGPRAPHASPPAPSTHGFSSGAVHGYDIGHLGGGNGNDGRAGGSDNSNAGPKGADGLGGVGTGGSGHGGGGGRGGGTGGGGTGGGGTGGGGTGGGAGNMG